MPPSSPSARSAGSRPPRSPSTASTRASCALHYPRAATADDYARAISLVADGTLAVERLHTHAFALEDVGDALATSATPDALKVTVAP